MKSVAEERKQELQVFLHELLSLAAEIAEVGCLDSTLSTVLTLVSNVLL